MELFRRAALDNNQEAWEAIYAQYRPLVTSWIRRHPAFGRSAEDEAYFVNRALEKLWGALQGEQFARFSSLAGILRYLQLCVHSALVDHARKQPMPSLSSLEAVLPDGSSPPEPASVDPRLEDIERSQFWQLVQGKLRDERERQLVYGCYVLGLKPGELCREFRDLFPSSEQVYLAKQNVLARLRRDPDLQRWLGTDD